MYDDIQHTILHTHYCFLNPTNSVFRSDVTRTALFSSKSNQCEALPSYVTTAAGAVYMYVQRASVLSALNTQMSNMYMHHSMVWAVRTEKRGTLRSEQ